MRELLKAENLTKTFTQSGRKPFTAVDGVNLTLREGEILGIVGESGSGKSTIAKLLTRLIDTTDGRIELDGADVTHLKGQELRQIYRKIQMVFQNPVGSFDPRRTLGHGIAESLRNSGMSKKETQKKVEELLVQCGLTPDFASRYPHEVSGGQCQRAAIARALAIAPKILICDEATSALDVTVQKQILELLQELQKTNHMSYIFICHNLALVQMLCDRVLVLYDGKIVEEGTPDEVILSPKSEYTKRLVDSVL
jgi:peptide/nickel transport system ATP-binding protein